MAVAIAYPEPIKNKRHSLAAKELASVNSGALSQARTVQRENKQLAMEVMAGKSVEAAYSEIRRKAKAQEAARLRRQLPGAVRR